MIKNKDYNRKQVSLISLVSFFLGAVIFGSIGVVLATSTPSSTVGYVTNKNNDVLTVEDALDDLYSEIIDHPSACFNGICGKVSYRYWNNNFAGGTGANVFSNSQMPTASYATRALLAENYGISNFNNRPFYIRTTLINDTIVGHQVCMYTNNREKCLSENYWTGTIGTPDIVVAENTKIRLEREMENEFNLSSNDISCTAVSTTVSCYVGTSGYGLGYDGHVNCRDAEANCVVSGIGQAYCYEF